MGAKRKKLPRDLRISIAMLAGATLFTLAASFMPDYNIITTTLIGAVGGAIAIFWA